MQLFHTVDGLNKTNWAGWVIRATSLAIALSAHASENQGRVLSNNLPVPGAIVTAVRGTTKFVTISDAQGNYSFADLSDGTWKMDVKMFCFVPAERNIIVVAGAPATQWELKMLSLEQVMAQTKIIPPSGSPSAAQPQVSSVDGSGVPIASTLSKAQNSADVSSSAEDGLLLNGSVNNAATSPFSLAQAFGNARNNSRNLYNGGIGLIVGGSVLDARPYSLSGLDTPKPSYNQITAVASVGGPLNIPHLMSHGPNFAITYQWTRNDNASAETGLVPTVLQRTNTVSSIDPVAQALLALYPLPNVPGNSNYNYQIPVLNGMHKDALQTHLDRSIGSQDSLSGIFGFQSTRSDQTNLFGFRDATATLGLDASVNLQHRFAHNLSGRANYSFSRLRTQVIPYFENRVNVSGNAGMTGNLQNAANWGPPTLVFSSGISSLTDAQSSFDRNQTGEVGGSIHWFRGRHNVTSGGDFRRQEFNYFSQENPRGTFTFTGDAFGSDFADFLRGVPDTASIVYGNADKYLRQSVYDLYATDDWRLLPELTLNVGVRWEYGAPITELKDRLVNLDVVSGFSAVAPVLAGAPLGPLTGEHYPNSLLRPDRSHIEPRFALAWRPFATDSLVVRAGYGIYTDTSVYQNIALQLAQQAPFSKSVSASNTICSQSLKTGPNACSSVTSDTFGIDPNFRVGYAQTWQLAMQRDLPAALQMTITYLGVKGSNGVQQFLPNTYPLGASAPCPDCPSGFLYRISSGSSTREAGTVQIRRRLRSGLAASLQYTYSKSIDDDAALGGQGPLAAGATSAAATTLITAQNWLDLRAERGLSAFDQRHLVNATLQYTTGMGLGGGTLLRGWLGRTYKEWTILGTVTAGSGLPETPVYLAAVNGTGFSGSIRPDRTSASIYAAPAGYFLNPEAFTAPPPGQWGNASRDSITGPEQLTFNSSLSRTFRLSKRLNLDVRADATNVLNHVVFTSYNTTVDPTLFSPLFGLPTAANAMRSLQMTARLRF
jgi:trimeric autotransporter adhesin